MSINFEYFKLFYYISQYGNITKAAEKLLISRSAVAQELKKLEDQLSLTLFKRHSRGVELTPEGSILYSKIKDNVKGLIEAENLATELSKTETGFINIGCTRFTVLHVFQEIINEFQGTYPGITVQSSIIPFNYIQNALDSGLVEMVIGSRYSYMQDIISDTFKRPSTQFHSLGMKDDVIIAHKHMKKIIAAEPDMKTLSKFPLILYRDHGMDDFFNKELRSPLAKDQDLFISDLSTIFRLLKTTDSIALVNRIALCNRALPSDFFEIHIVGERPQSEYIIHMPEKRSTSLVANKLIDFIIHHKNLA